MTDKLLEMAVGFIHDYDTNYGTIKTYMTKDRIIIETYNGGWSENEELEQEFIFEAKKMGMNVLVDDHPCHILEIRKLRYHVKEKNFIKIDNENMKKFKELVGDTIDKTGFDYRIKLTWEKD